MRFVRLARVWLVLMVALVGAGAPVAASAQDAGNSLFIGTVSIDGYPAPNLRTVVTVEGNGLECGHGLTEGGAFSIVLTCPVGVATVYVNGVRVDRIDVAPGRTVVRRISMTSGGTSPLPTGVPTAAPTSPGLPPAILPPKTGNTAPGGVSPAWPAAAAGLVLLVLGLAAAGLRRGSRSR